MKGSSLIIAALMCTLTFSCFDYSQHGKNWQCELCRHGHRQSPINLEANFINHSFEPDCVGMAFKIQNRAELDTVNNGNTYQTNTSFCEIDLIDQDYHFGHYNVTQFHFHVPSEHTINDERYDLEIHIVAKRVAGDSEDLTVVGILFDITDDPEQESLFFKQYQFPEKSEGASIHQMGMDFQKIFNHVLDDNTLAYRYKGSLTTGSCSENVNWYVISHPLKITIQKFEKFQSQWTHTKEMPEGNNRELQNVNGRKVDFIKFCSSLISY